jgi:hypothetical protein
MKRMKEHEEHHDEEHEIEHEEHHEKPCICMRAMSHA